MTGTNLVTIPTKSPHLRLTTAFGGSTIKRTRFVKAITRACLLALLLSFAGGAVSLRAQEPAAAPKQPAPDSVRQDSVRQPKPGGPGHQLAHETREAAGEEKDEMGSSNSRPRSG